MSVVAAAALAADKRIIRGLQQHGASSPETAVAYAPERRFVLRRLERLLRRGVVVESTPGQFYLDEAALGSYRNRQRQVAGLAFAAVGLLAVAFAF